MTDREVDLLPAMPALGPLFAKALLPRIDGGPARVPPDGSGRRYPAGPAAAGRLRPGLRLHPARPRAAHLAARADLPAAHPPAGRAGVDDPPRGSGARLQPHAAAPSRARAPRSWTQPCASRTCVRTGGVPSSTWSASSAWATNSSGTGSVPISLRERRSTASWTTRPRRARPARTGSSPCLRSPPGGCLRIWGVTTAASPATRTPSNQRARCARVRLRPSHRAWHVDARPAAAALEPRLPQTCEIEATFARPILLPSKVAPGGGTGSAAAAGRRPSQRRTARSPILAFVRP